MDRPVGWTDRDTFADSETGKVLEFTITPLPGRAAVEPIDWATMRFDDLPCGCRSCAVHSQAPSVTQRAA